MGDPLDEYAAPPLYDGEWPPASWSVPQPGAQLQPGLGGIPASAIDNALAAPADPNYVDPASIQMEDPSYVDPASIEMEQPPALVPDAISSAGDRDPLPDQWHTVADVTGAPQFDPIPYTPQSDLTAGAVDQSRQMLPIPGLTPVGPVGTAAEEAAMRANGETDEQYGARKIAYEEAAKNDAAAERLKASAENHRQEQEHLDTLRAATVKARATSDQIAADASKLAERKIDPDRRGVGQRILGALAAFIGGLAAPSNGGRNVALEMIQRSIEQDIDAQKADLANAWKGIDTRKGAVATQGERDHEDFVATEATRLAWWKRIDNDLETKKQMFNPRGASALRIEGMQRDVRAK